MKLNEKVWTNWLISQLRRISYKWPERTKAKNRGRIERGVYRCNRCKNEFPAKSIQLDHRIPVVDPDSGFTGWSDYIERLFCDASGYQVLCRPCHKEKTVEENSRRTRKVVSK